MSGAQHSKKSEVIMPRTVTRTLYTSDEKRKYYGNQLRTGRDKSGKPLTQRQKAYRAGYCSAANDGTAAYYAKNPDRRPKK